MPVQTLYDTGENYLVDSKYDGAVYAASTPDGVLEGIGDQFALNYTASSLQVSFNAGSQAVIGGGFFKVTGLETVQLVANTTTYLCANIDLTKANGQRGSFVSRTSSGMQSDNLNGGGSTRDLLLYGVETNNSGVTNVTDKRVVRGAVTSISGLGLRVISQADYNALATQDPNTLYIIPES